MTGRLLLLVLATVSTGLMAGLLFGWLVSVIPGTARVDDPTYVHTMQQINTSIINPAFVIPFMATPLILAAAGVLEYRAGNQRRGLTLGAAAAVYLVGVLGVTVGGNIPLNDRLDRFDLTAASSGPVTAMRHDYEGPWNRWHALRTAAAALAFTLAVSAVLVTEDAA